MWVDHEIHSSRTRGGGNSVLAEQALSKWKGHCACYLQLRAREFRPKCFSLSRGSAETVSSRVLDDNHNMITFSY